MALTRAMKYFGDGDVVAAAAGAEFSGAGVDGTYRRSQTPRTGRSAGLNALETRLQLSHLQGQKHTCLSKHQPGRLGPFFHLQRAAPELNLDAEVC